MFQTIANLWRAARGDVLKKEVVDALGKLSKSHVQVQAISHRTFLDALAAIQQEYGPINNLSNDRRRVVAKRFKAAGRQIFIDNVGGAYGLFLVSAYLEASTLPGQEAHTASQMVAQYHFEAQAMQDQAMREGS